MRRLLTVLVTLAVPLVVATVPESGLVAIAAQQVTTIMPHDLQPVPNPQLPIALNHPNCDLECTKKCTKESLPHLQDIRNLRGRNCPTPRLTAKKLV